MYEKVNLIVCKNNESIFPIFLLLPEISGDQMPLLPKIGENLTVKLLFLTIAKNCV